MKIAAVLLSLMVILLNSVPCCWETCDDASGHVEETSGAADACSPFLSCGSCAGFVLQQEFTDIPSFTLPTIALDEQAEVRFQSDYAIKIWQPPKEVQ